MKSPTRLTPFQFFFVAVNLSFGASLLTMPRQVAETAREDMWMPVLLGGGLLLAAFWVAVRLAAYFPDRTILEYSRSLLGDAAGLALNVYLVILMVMMTAVMVRILVMAVRIHLLDQTPPMVVVSLMLLPAVYAVQYGLMPVVRTVHFLSLPGFGLFVVLILLGLLSVDTGNYLPVLADGVGPVLKAVIPTWFNYTGPEVAIGLLYPFFTRPKAIWRFGVAAIIFVTALYTLVTVIIQGILGADETARMLIPTVMAYRSVEIPDTFVERLDGYLLTFWTALCFGTEITWIYFIAFVTGRLAKLEYPRPLAALVVPWLIYLVHLPPDSQTAELFGRWTNLMSMAWSLGVLPLLLLLAWRRDRRRPPC
ncbi:MAG TPA: GerAB/ArcD/ProY family transporter [Negativicutes bacterium]|nr:GerAB/ArcD/ProY family transporter [Negativicutes bacterium]